ncbi:MAG: haloacid dehalogenase-like hydrolase [Bacteroidota bacterium]|nr:haloacid dehalogenase-like hydrolase [Bacteroidota bacterium]
MINTSDIFFDDDRVENIIKDWTKENIHIVTDFDRTLTSGDSGTSWSLISHAGILPEGYNIRRQEYYEYYRPIEINAAMPIEQKKEEMTLWWVKHLELLAEYKLKENVFDNITKGQSSIQFRDGAQELLYFCRKESIPIIIMSAGLGNVVESFLKNNNCLYENIHIISNFLVFKDGIVSGVPEHIIHSVNKNECELPAWLKTEIDKRPYPILMGDGIDDINMISDEQRKKALTIGFLDEGRESNFEIFQNIYDMVCINNCSLEPITKIISRKINFI